MALKFSEMRYILRSVDHGGSCGVPVVRVASRYLDVEGDTGSFPYMVMQEEDIMDRYAISVLLFQEGERWSAQCLQYDIAAQAATLPELHYEIQRVLVGHMVVSKELGVDPFESLGAAPQKFWDMYLQSHLRVETESLPFRVPRTLDEPVPVPEFRIGSEQIPQPA